MLLCEKVSKGKGRNYSPFRSSARSLLTVSDQLRWAERHRQKYLYVSQSKSQSKSGCQFIISFEVEFDYSVFAANADDD
ncbi:hypothetical protein NIES2111_06640 [Nostoc sp. NIES-2111]|nr:hypothetical protein NIES2111_06640 [Nostoc sp. NIES-2111]